jgi:hypothetical protein
VRTKYLKTANEACPEGGFQHKYRIVVDQAIYVEREPETWIINVYCANEKDFHDHSLSTNE